MSLNLDTNLDICDLAFNGKLNHNFEKINAKYDGTVIDIVNELPENPSKNDSYILDANNNYVYYYFDGDNWQGDVVGVGEIFWVQDKDRFYYRNLSSIVELAYYPYIDIESAPRKNMIQDTDILLIKDSINRSVTFKTIADEIISRVNSGIGSDPLPVGTILTYPSMTMPSDDYMSCDGSLLSRSVFSDLFAKIGETHGAGNGVTTFAIPDYRQRVLRMIGSSDMNIDPDKDSRLPMASGANSGNNIGSVQGSFTKLPKNAFDMEEGGYHAHTGNYGAEKLPPGPTIQMRYAFRDVDLNVPPPGGAIPAALNEGYHKHTIIGGDAQTAMPNAYVNFIIKVK